MVGRLYAHQAAYFFIAGLSPLADQIVVDPFFMDAIFEQVLADSFLDVVFDVDVPGYLVVDFHDGPE